MALTPEGVDSCLPQLDEWLSEAKIGGAHAEILRNRNVTVDELLGFESDDLAEFLERSKIR